MAKRIKLDVQPAIVTREEMEMVVADIASLTITKDNLTVQMDGHIQEVRERYDILLATVDIELEKKMALAKEWAEANQEAFGQAKSLDMTHGTVGFRTGMPKLKLLSGWTWDKVMERVSDPYLRTEKTINKELILGEREQLGDAGLRMMGVKVVQDESFYVAPKREELEPARQTA
jgi:phage host-nuclease inhibitor protein Gam